MAKRVKKRYHLRIFGYRIGLTSLLFLLFLGSLLYNIIIGVYGLAVNYRRLELSGKAIEEKSRREEQLQAEKESWQTGEFLEEEAKRLGLVKEDDCAPARLRTEGGPDQGE